MNIDMQSCIKYTYVIKLGIYIIFTMYTSIACCVFYIVRTNYIYAYTMYHAMEGLRENEVLSRDSMSFCE